jgi:crossover junction endodeoxyribonuclease RuvC
VGKYILGVDPGISGALALLDPTKRSGNYPYGRLLGVWDMPTTKVRLGNKRTVDPWGVDMILTAQGGSVSIGLAVVEEVGVMSGHEGRKSMFNFGQSYGLVQGVIATHYIEIQLAKPGVWKSLLNLSPDKRTSLNMVRKLFPNEKDRFSRVKDHGRAEALLLAVCAVKLLIR